MSYLSLICVLPAAADQQRIAMTRKQLQKSVSVWSPNLPSDLLKVKPKHLIQCMASTAALVHRNTDVV